MKKLRPGTRILPLWSKLTYEIEVVSHDNRMIVFKGVMSTITPEIKVPYKIRRGGTVDVPDTEVSWMIEHGLWTILGKDS